jgi:hypothetical protein
MVSFWADHFDRQIMAKEVLPEIGRLSGSKGKVLEIGFMTYNIDDAERAFVNKSQWYFNELQSKLEMKSNPNSLIGPMHSLHQNPQNLHAFKVVYDYGVLGHTPIWWRNNSLNLHMEAYDKLLENNGFLFLKVDLEWPPTNFIWWPIIRNNLAKLLEPISSDCKGTTACKPKIRLKMAELDAGFEYTEGSLSSNFSTIATGCDAFCFTKWRYREDYKPSVNISKWNTFTDWHLLEGYGRKMKGPRRDFFIN